MNRVEDFFKNQKENIRLGLLVIIKNEFLIMAALADKPKFENEADRTKVYRSLIESGFYFYKELGVFIKIKNAGLHGTDFSEQRELVEELAESARRRVGN